MYHLITAVARNYQTEAEQKRTDEEASDCSYARDVADVIKGSPQGTNVSVKPSSHARMKANQMGNMHDIFMIAQKACSFRRSRDPR